MAPKNPEPQTNAEPLGEVRSAERGRSAQSLALQFLAIVLACSAVLQAYRLSAPSTGLDFYQFWVVGRAVASSEHRNIYSEQERQRLGLTYLREATQGRSALQLKVAMERRVLETTASPFLYTVFGAFSSASYEGNLRLYRMLLLGCFAASVLGVSRLLGHDSTTLGWLALGVLGLGSEALASDLRVGNVSSIQLAAIVIYAHLRLKLDRRLAYAISGTWLGLVIAFKPNLVILAGVLALDWVFARDWRRLLREFLAVAVGLLLAIGTSCYVFRSWSVWFDWIGAMRRIPPANIGIEMGNFAPQVILGRYMDSYVGGALSLVLIVLIIGGAYVRRRRLLPGTTLTQRQAPQQLVWLLAIGNLGSLLVLKLAWLHYFVLAVPGLMMVLTPGVEASSDAKRRQVWLLSGGAWLGLSINPFVALGLRFTIYDFGVLILTASLALFGSLLALPAPTVSARD